MVTEQEFINIASQELGIAPDEVLKYAKMSHYEADAMCRDAWDKLNPKTEEEVVRYYTNDPAFSLFHLRSINGKIGDYLNLDFFNRIEKFIPNIRNRRILDYGCGNGGIGITFANSDCNQVWLADVPLPLFRILKRVLSSEDNKNSKSSRINFIDITEKFPLKENYDFISCMDVLEHVVNPDLILKHLVEHLNKDGYLYIDVFFGGAHAPYHLVENNKFIPIWKDIIKSCGLDEVSINDIGGANGLYVKR